MSIKNEKTLYLVIGLFIIFVVVSILYIFPSLKYKKENENYFLNEELNNTTNKQKTNVKDICNVDKDQISKKAQSLGISYQVYEVKVPEKI